MSLNSRRYYQNQRTLPILQHKHTIIEAIQNYQVIVITGDTGSGKTTQLPQYIYEHNLHKNKEIIITQPRRIAAINIAKRVAYEMGCSLGDKVGYEIRFEKNRSKDTKIKFITDGILLNKFVKDPELWKFGVIIIDEAHERSICTDVIIGLLKRLMKTRTDLKIIITSATIKSQKFSEYFNSVPIIEVGGRMYPVEEIYEPIETSINDKIYSIITKIHSEQSDGDVLIFLPGEEEIEKCCECLEDMKGLVVLPLHASMDYKSQQQIFDPVKMNERKVIVSTNIAETSITIDGIRFVIDAGYVKQIRFDYIVRMDILETVRISKSQADQRKGRAGRTNTGWCYRLYSCEDYELFSEEVEPEILRNDLCPIELQMISMNIDPFTFNFLDIPKRNELLLCAKELQNLECLDNNCQITHLGKCVNRFPVDPIIGTVLYLSPQYDCSLDIITIFAMLLEKNVFLNSRKFRNKLGQVKTNFYDPDGDHFMFLNIFNKWIENSRSSKWCYDNCINFKVLENVYLVREQLIKIMKGLNLSINPSSAHLDRRKIVKCILNVFRRKICQFQSPGIYENIHNEMIFYVHPGSSLMNKHNKIILYHNAIKTNKPYITGLLNIDEYIYNEVLQKRRIDNEKLMMEEKIKSYYNTKEYNEKRNTKANMKYNVDKSIYNNLLQKRRTNNERTRTKENNEKWNTKANIKDSVSTNGFWVVVAFIISLFAIIIPLFKRK